MLSSGSMIISCFARPPSLPSWIHFNMFWCDVSSVEKSVDGSLSSRKLTWILFPWNPKSR
jgi:hypothetical protein